MLKALCLKVAFCLKIRAEIDKRENRRSRLMFPTLLSELDFAALYGV